MIRVLAIVVSMVSLPFIGAMSIASDDMLTRMICGAGTLVAIVTIVTLM